MEDGQQLAQSPQTTMVFIHLTKRFQTVLVGKLTLMEVLITIQNIQQIGLKLSQMRILIKQLIYTVMLS